MKFNLESACLSVGEEVCKENSVTINYFSVHVIDLISVVE